MSPQDVLSEDVAGRQHVVQPVSATVCLQRHLTPAPLRSRSQPRLACHLTLPSFPVTLTDQQYAQMVRPLLQAACYVLISSLIALLLSNISTRTLKKKNYKAPPPIASPIFVMNSKAKISLQSGDCQDTICLKYS